MTTLSLAWLMATGCSKPAQPGLAFSGETTVDHVQLLVDETWVDAAGQRHVDQEIFDSAFSMIDEAEDFILIDFFLMNDFLYSPAPGMRMLSAELAEKLVAKRKSHPEVEITFITDPINTVYGSLPSSYFTAMEQAGVRVVWTDLDQLRDSNALFSKPWRVLGKPWGTGPGTWCRNPMGEGRVSMRSMLKLMNFKANHRKVVVTEKSLLVTSANPHSGSSAHWNVALRVDGAGMLLALQAESAILRLSGAADFKIPEVRIEPATSDRKLELLTERKIKDKALAMLADAEPGARIDLSMFYFSDQDLVRAFIAARQRGCDIRVILDPNKDAFGRTKNGIPNRQTAAKLVKAGIQLRWADTHGEQCHAKMLYVEHADKTATLLLGSGNYTRRNLDNFNAECDMALTTSQGDPCMGKARASFDRWWSNTDGRIYTTSYETYVDRSIFRQAAAWWMETTGMGTF
ncbi:MAG: hypothetical protein K9L89_01110 [Kiritimatiellales bacterium]|nr:hypothetical protein [Kiritimatiellales bacterium]